MKTKTVLKLAAISTLALICNFARPSLAADQNLLSNGGFEQGTDTWKVAPGEGISTVSTEQATTGKASLKITDADDKRGSDVTSSKFPAHPGDTFKLSGKVFVVSGNGFAIYVRFADQNGKMLGTGNEYIAQAPLTPLGQWSPLSLEARAPDGAAAIYLWLHSYGSAKVTLYVDDLALTPGANGVPPVAMANANAAPIAPPATPALPLAQGQRGDVIFQANFEGATPLQGWGTPSAGSTALVQANGYNGSQSLLVERPVAAGAGFGTVSIPLPVEKMRGAKVQMDALIKAENVAPPAQRWNGLKFMLVVAAPAGTRYINPQNVSGTFDWKPFSFVETIPRDATATSLVLGLEATTGRAWFDDVKVSIATPPLDASAVAPNVGPLPLIYKGGVPRLRGVMISPSVTDEDLRVLSTWNANVVRWQFRWLNGAYRTGTQDVASYDTWLDTMMSDLDKKLPLFQQLGIMVVIDLHTPPGGSEENADWRLFEKKEYQDQFLRTWDKIARHYKDQKIVWGYDLANEPVEGVVASGLMDWRTLVTKAAQNVRAIDPLHPLIVEPSPWGGVGALDNFAPIPVKGVVYSVHMYEPAHFTHQGLYDNPMGISYPGTVDGKMWDKEQLRRTLHPALNFQNKYKVPIYIGEFSAVRWAPGDSAANYLRDLTDLFEEYNWDWSYHAFREFQGWSVEYGGDKNATTPSSTPTERKKLLLAQFAKNQKVTLQPVGLLGTQIYPRWLVIGDSITAHGPKPELSWTEPTRGMAASTVDSDYVHQLQHLLQGRDPKNGTEMKIFGRFARMSAGTIDQMNAAMGEIKTFDADLVTIQLGENENLAQIGREEFEHRYRLLIDNLLVGPKHPKIVCTGVWDPNGSLDPADPTSYTAGSESRQKDDIIRAICREKGSTFVPVAPFATQPENHGAGQNDGVKWHPNDNGMTAYAQAIFGAL